MVKGVPLLDCHSAHFHSSRHFSFHRASSLRSRLRDLAKTGIGNLHRLRRDTVYVKALWRAIEHRIFHKWLSSNPSPPICTTYDAALLKRDERSKPPPAGIEPIEPYDMVLKLTEIKKEIN
jgi:hypothetical protein